MQHPTPDCCLGVGHALAEALCASTIAQWASSGIWLSEVLDTPTWALHWWAVSMADEREDAALDRLAELTAINHRRAAQGLLPVIPTWLRGTGG